MAAFKASWGAPVYEPSGQQVGQTLARSRRKRSVKVAGQRQAGAWSDGDPRPLRRLPDTKNGFVGKQSGALATAQHGVSSSLSKLSVNVPLDVEDGAGAVSERCDEADWETDDGEHDTILNFLGCEGPRPPLWLKGSPALLAFEPLEGLPLRGSPAPSASSDC